MQSAPDQSTVDLTRTIVRLRDDLIFSPQVYQGEIWYHLELPSVSQFYRIGYHEYVFLSLLDGRTSFSQALALTARSLGASAFGQEQALALYEWLLESEIATFENQSSPTAADRAPKRSAARILQAFNPFWIRIPLGRPDAVLKRIQPLCGWLFSPAATLCGIVVMLAAGYRVAADWTRFQTASESVFAVGNWLWLLLAWMILKTVHETAHGLVCRRYGGSVRETGIILAFLAPLAYVDVSSCWRFSSRWQRMHVAVAGMYLELLLAAIAALTWTHVSSSVLSHLLYNIIIMASASTLLFNANPLMKFDGYYILSDWLQLPNMATRASATLTSGIQWLLFGIRNSAPEMVGHQLWWLRIYGLAAAVWRIVICVAMLIAASVLFRGAGVALAIAGCVAWFGLPVWQMVNSVVGLGRTAPLRLARGAVVLTVCALFLAGFLFQMPVPFLKAAPGVVSLPEGFRVRSAVDGFVDQIHVQDGQQVTAGTLLMTLRNAEITNRHFDLQLQIEQETIRQQIAMKDYDAGAASVAASNLQSLRDRLQETLSQKSGLNVYAPADGSVVADHLDWKPGVYVKEGTDLLTIDDQRSRELRVSVAQQDFSLAESQLKQSVSIRVGTRPAFEGTLVKVVPRASRRLFAPSLAATEGGDLPVMASADDENPVQLTDRRFEAVIALDPASTSVLIGERGHVTLGSLDDSLAGYVYDRVESWLRRQIQVAVQAEREHRF